MGIDHSKLSFYCETEPADFSTGYHENRPKVKSQKSAFAKAHSLQADYSVVSLGVRSKRFSMIVDNGIVKSFQIVDKAENDADVLLGQC